MGLNLHSDVPVSYGVTFDVWNAAFLELPLKFGELLRVQNETLLVRFGRDALLSVVLKLSARQLEGMPVDEQI